MSDSPAVLVIGAGPCGLIAATYLADAGARVIVLEAEAVTGGAYANRIALGDLAVPAGAHTLHALDPRVVKELKLTRFGLKFAARDLALVGLRSDGKPLLLGRDGHAAARSIALVSQRDAERFVGFRRDLFAAARTMRAVWWEDGKLDDAAAQTELRRLSMTSAGAFLDAAFEAEALKAAFAFDALEGGPSPSATGSSLLFAWRAAQEVCGLQGAVAIPRGGMSAFADTLAAAAQAAGVEIRTGAQVTQLRLNGDAVSGVVLASGEEIPASAVLSSLSRSTTLLELAPAGVAGFATTQRLRRPPETGEAKLVLALNTVPGFAALQPMGRFVVADRLESCIAAHAEARAGRLPAELALEAVAPASIDPSLAPSGICILSVLVRPLPVTPAEGWPALTQHLVETVLTALEHHAPGLKASITAMNFVPPKARDLFAPAHLLLDWRKRIATPVEGLFLCGEAAEPVPSVSGRAARLAAAMATARLKGGAR